MLGGFFLLFFLVCIKQLQANALVLQDAATVRTVIHTTLSGEFKIYIKKMCMLSFCMFVLRMRCRSLFPLQVSYSI